MAIVAAGLLATVLAPLAFGSVALIHELRGARHDVRTSILMAAGIWAGVVVGTRVLMTLLVSPICVR
jgi:hypothetical protein